jgi:chromosome partitioning protein
VIVIGGHKGGVGRTVVAANLASMLALAGQRTLLLDLDPKGDATASVGLPRATVPKSLDRMADPWGLLKDIASANAVPGLDVWQGGGGIEALRAELNQESSPPTDLLDRGLELARQRYRAIVIDAPPDLGPLGCNALGAGDVLLLPLSSSTFAERALEETIATACALRADVTVLGVRIMIRDIPFEQEAEPGARGPLGIELLDVPIAYDAEPLLRATEAGVPVFEHDPASRVSRCFLELAREILARFVTPPASPTASGRFPRAELPGG